MNYQELLETLKKDIPSLRLIDNTPDVGIVANTERYPEGIYFYHTSESTYTISTNDSLYPYQNMVKAIEFFVKKAKQDPAK